jgi:hypothetical protein
MCSCKACKRLHEKWLNDFPKGNLQGGVLSFG